MKRVIGEINNMKKGLAEFIGTHFLVFIGTSTAVIGEGPYGTIGITGIALAFGLTIVAAAYSIGTVSGAHLNPAVSIAMWFNKRITSSELLEYVLGQLLGAFFIETILTFIFVLVIMTVTSKNKGNSQLAGLVIGLTLTMIHFVGIPLTGMSANPARSLAPALLVGGQALNQVWVFILAPIVGAVLAAYTAKNLLDTEA